MNIRDIEAAVSAIEDRYILEAGKTIKRQERSARGLPRRFPCRLLGGFLCRFLKQPLGLPRSVLRRLRIAAACLAGAVFLSASSLLAAVAAGSMPAYEILFSLYPETAKRLTPVQVSCEDNGIRMEVEAVYVHADTAEICLSMQDLAGERIDETVDLFDSYSICSSGDSSGTCSLIDFDPESGKAFFLVQMKQRNGEKIDGQKVDFRVSGFLTGKQRVEKELPEMDLSQIEEKAELQLDVSVRGSGGMDMEKVEEEERKGFLKPDEGQTFSPVDGVTVTAYGWVDGRLHIQVHYADILKTDNHGYVYLKDGQGNVVSSFGSVSFWDEEQTGSYQEYFFEVETEMITEGWSVWGYFSTCSELVKGDWRVTFPME
ncbi:MAG TPA: hypothetical protein H9717_00050 [Candidatus Eisenbergiella merdipullorum]|uniref:DUF4179 domain-containing protein n=1 Tax=Candidatus Eisenbergiella merdipullorum TaxID=2838553 RepID=A0A9D2KXJ5_9FIRM|nr:hypothetical protein [Candidatus Eisenbergiella merdipullorum]